MGSSPTIPDRLRQVLQEFCHGQAAAHRLSEDVGRNWSFAAMNLYRLLQHRHSERWAPASGRPYRGRQVRHHVFGPGAQNAGAGCRLGGGSGGRAGGSRLGRAAATATTPRQSGCQITEDAACLIAHPDIEVVIEATGHPAAGIRHASAGGARRQTYRHGDGGGRCSGRALAGARGSGGRAGLFARLRRSAGLDCRTGGLGPGGRLSRGGSGQGHQVSAGFPRLDAGDGLVSLWPQCGDGGRRRHEPADVQLLSGRHQIGHRDGGRGQCLRSGRAPRGPCLSALRFG